MAFEDIDRIGPARSGIVAIPPQGVAVFARKLGRRTVKNAPQTRYIRVVIGVELARKLSLTQPTHRLRLLFGTDVDSGKVRVSVDNEAGKFPAKRDKRGNYVTTINAATAEGLFALDFPAFAEARCEAIRPANGQPPHFIFHPSTAMLAAED